MTFLSSKLSVWLMFCFAKFEKLFLLRVIELRMNTNEKCLLKFLYNPKESFFCSDEETFDYKKYDEVAIVQFYGV